MKIKENSELPTDGALVPLGALQPWEKALLGATKAAISAMGSEVATLKIRGRVLRVAEDMLGDYADVVIAAFAPYRAYYNAPYNAGGEPAAPVCWANAALLDNGLPDTNEDALAPLAGVPERQSDRCADCRMNGWGTAVNGGRGKGCAERARVSLLIIGSEKSGAVTDPRQAVSAVLDLSSTARPALRKHLQRLSDAGAPYFSVISRVSLDPSRDWPSPCWEPIAAVQPSFKERVHEAVTAGPKLVTASPWPLKDTKSQPPAVAAPAPAGVVNEEADEETPF